MKKTMSANAAFTDRQFELKNPGQYPGVFYVKLPTKKARLNGPFQLNLKLVGLCVAVRFAGREEFVVALLFQVDGFQRSI